MHISLSVATSADHCIDDTTPARLVLSTAEDWAEVYRLRATNDAILVGGETLRRDNPSLGIKCDGREPIRVVVSGRGEISPASKIFHRGSSPIIIFSNIQREELEGLAEVVVAERIDVALIVTELEKRGVERLFVEGGATILQLFMESSMVDELRVAVNPSIVVGDVAAPRFSYVGSASRVEKYGEMEVSTYLFARGDTSGDRALMQMALKVSQSSPERESCYRVGSVVKTLTGEIYEGYTLETAPTHHAEQAAITKALRAGADLRGATIYASMEPCSVRNSEPESCSAIILRCGIRRVVFALYEPSHFVECHGAENLRRAGVDVRYMGDMAEEVISINSHILRPL
ncbi:MAG: dihydrofolate reductase family protein [Rikenellaceae bacterium]